MLRGILRLENLTYVLVAAARRGFTMVSFTEAVSRRNTFAGGTCALPSALLLTYIAVCTCILLLPATSFRSGLFIFCSIRPKVSLKWKWTVYSTEYI